MFELARYQKKVLKQAAGAEMLENEASEMIIEKAHQRTRTQKEYGKYSECYSSKVPTYLKKAMSPNSDPYYIRIWF